MPRLRVGCQDKAGGAAAVAAGADRRTAGAGLSGPHDGAETPGDARDIATTTSRVAARPSVARVSAAR